jgi:ribosome assembly protein YihI (activator of Der GTPase)
MYSWSIFHAQTNHEHTRIHKTHHDPDLGEATTFPLIVFSMINHKGYIQMSLIWDS